MLFDRHFCTTPICCVSRASIMLGQYAATHGIYDFSTALTAAQVDRSYFFRIRKAGYYTGFIGKFGVGDHMPTDSFDVWHGFPGQGTYFSQGEGGPHLTDVQRDQANDFLHGAPRDRPFCLSISFKAPHVQDEDPRQYLPSRETLPLYEDVEVPAPRGAGPEDILRFPLPFQRSENRRRWAIRFSTPELYQASTKGYYRLINGIDAAIGSVRRTLQQEGLAENTVIIYSADHGIFNGEHGFAGKWYAHEESIRIPLIIYDPRLTPSERGKRSSAMSLNIDLNPTLLDLAGLPASEGTQGRSLVAQLRGEEHTLRSNWFIEHRFPLNGFIPSSDAVRTGRWKYIRYTDVAAPFEELYDLQTDPHETDNLAGSSQHADQLHAMRRYCTEWKASFAAKDDASAGVDAWRDPVSAADLTRDGLT